MLHLVALRLMPLDLRKPISAVSPTHMCNVSRTLVFLTLTESETTANLSESNGRTIACTSSLQRLFAKRERLVCVEGS
jgi:hypothetical protein